MNPECRLAGSIMGQMVARGTYSELQGSGIDFTSLLKEDQDDEGQNMTPLSGTSSSCHYTLSDNSSMSSLSSSRCSLIDGGDILTAVVHPIEEESRLEGNVGLSMYVKYFLAGANLLVLLFLILLNGLAHISFVLQDWWLAQWKEEDPCAGRGCVPIQGLDPSKAVLVGRLRHSATRKPYRRWGELPGRDLTGLSVLSSCCQSSQ
ncbi:hypothetical protein AMECASPLE_015259 [Ameca splendens]|uniref:Uncharacterized protein n=1 Tax=Ameca splendens TaxID=208324 RepID=A0ABV0ZNQ8_9TELE